MKKKLLVTLLVGLFFLAPVSTFAAKGDQGVDLSIWNGYQATFGYSHDNFTNWWAKQLWDL